MKGQERLTFSSDSTPSICLLKILTATLAKLKKLNEIYDQIIFKNSSTDNEYQFRVRLFNYPRLYFLILPISNRKKRIFPFILHR